MKRSSLNRIVREKLKFPIKTNDINDLLHQYNGWEMPISKRLQLINIDDFCNYIKLRIK